MTTSSQESQDVRMYMEERRELTDDDLMASNTSELHHTYNGVEEQMSASHDNELELMNRINNNCLNSGGSQQHTQHNRQHICTVCGRNCPTKWKLERHMTTHSSDKPHACELCGKCFSHKGLLTQHLKRHSGFKAYKCTECDKEYSLKRDLERHMDVHRAEMKPFSRV